MAVAVAVAGTVVLLWGRSQKLCRLTCERRGLLATTNPCFTPPGEQVRVFRFHYISHTGVADLDAAWDMTRRKQAGCGRWKEALPGVSRL